MFRPHARLAGVVCLLALIASTGSQRAPAAQTAPADPKQVTVYLTDIGLQYHREGCRLLKSKIPVTLAEAKTSGYIRCRVCKPPA